MAEEAASIPMAENAVTTTDSVVSAAPGKGKGKGAKGASKAVPAPRPKAKAPVKPQETFKLKVREGGLQSAGYTIHTDVKGTRTAQWTDGTTRIIPKGYHGDIEELKSKPQQCPQAPAAEPKPESNEALQALLAQHPELADVDALYRTGVPLAAVRARIQGQFGDKLAFRFCEALAAGHKGSPEDAASNELKGEPEALHGRLGDPSWAPPALAAECMTLARPGYNSGMAHEYLDAEWVLEKKVAILAELIKNAKQFVIYAGAGLSTGAGISDYATRSGTAGVLGKSEKPAAPVSPMKAKPSYGHRVIAAMAKQNLIWRFIQQNHDGLPQKAGLPQSIINEIHGGWFDPSNPVVKMSGTLRSDLFKDLNLCERKADLVLVLGSSLCGMNADRLVATCAQRARVSSERNKVWGSVIVSLQTTPHDGNSSVRFFATIDHVMELLAKQLHLEVPEEDPLFPQVEAVHRPLGADVDVFAVPYGEEGELLEGGATRQWDLRTGARHVITVGQFKGWKTIILGKTDDGHYRVGIRDPKMVQGDYHDVKIMGSWWIDAAVSGSVPCIPMAAPAAADDDAGRD